MRIPIIEVIAGTTIRPTLTNSGVTYGLLGSALLTGSETLVHSVAAVSSGDGRYYAMHPVPPEGGWYVNEWIGVVGVNTYRERQLVRASRLEVD